MQQDDSGPAPHAPAPTPSTSTDIAPAALTGALAAAVALGIGELLGGIVPDAPSLLKAVGDGAVDLAPPAAKDFAVAAFGTADKPALLIGIAVVALLIGAGLGIAGRRAPWRAVAGIAAFAALGLLAALADPLASSVGAWVTALGAGVAGITVYRRLHRRAQLAWQRGATTTMAGNDSARRDFLRASGAAGLLAVTAGIAGRMLASASTAVESARQAISLPRAARALPSPPPGLAVRGLTPLYVPNSRFYRIDTALSSPRVDVDTWSLTLGGPQANGNATYTYEQLLAMELIEADVTIACVSNEVGGDLVGNARWLGLPLATLLAPLVPDSPIPGTQVVARSVDGFTAAFPLEALQGDRVALLAVGMNGEPLPIAHGFPARLVVSGLYGYVSATKWLASVELHGPDFEGYWIPRGWAKEAPVKTQSRIDVPRHGADVDAGRVAIAGVAWAPNRGVDEVQVRIDDAEWQAATLSASIGANAWRQWMLAWDANPGRHRITVRATDGLGRLQTDRLAAPRPDGATGHHTIEVHVT